VVLALLLPFGFALTGVILSQRHTGPVRESPYLWTLRRREIGDRILKAGK
jgi:hypothetical protein